MGRRIWTISNVLSLLRIVLIVPISLLLLRDNPPDRYIAACLIVIAAITDLLDGMVARWMNQVTDLGKIIDPVADKLSVGVVGVILAIRGEIPPWFIVCALARDLAIFLGGLYLNKTKGILLQSTWPGKWAVGVMAAFILATILDGQDLVWLRDILLVASGVMLLLSFILYLKRFLGVIAVSQPNETHN